MKWILFLSVFFLTTCAGVKNTKKGMNHSVLNLPISDSNFNTHIKNGNYIISVKEGFKEPIIEELRIRYKDTLNLSIFEKDTIDLNLTNRFFTRQPIIIELRKRFDDEEVLVYSLSKSKYINTIHRTVSNFKLGDTHNYYLYSNRSKRDTVFYSYYFSNTSAPF